MKPKMISPFAVGLLATAGLASAAPVTITVNSTADTIANDGVCTLREAINGNTSDGCVAGPASETVDAIAFAIPGTDLGCSGGPPKICTIALSSALPDISRPIFIDGYTQPNASANSLAVGDNAVILIRLEASNITGTAVHLAGGSDGSTVRGLSLVKAGGDANNLSYLMTVNSNNNVVTGNFIGVEPDGATVSTDKLIFAALEIGGTSSGNTIGGTSPAARNLVAAINAGTTHALDFDPGTAINNVVQGNYFDLDASGSNGIGNASIAVHVNSGGTTIGGSAGGSGNVIGAWGTAGLQVESSVFAPVATITVQGNRIGTDATATVALTGAGLYGIAVGGSNGTITIGGSAPGAGNLTRGAANGILVFGTASAGTPVIQGNHVGVSLDGTRPLPSGTSGINISGGNGGLIGGTAPGQGNVIAFNGANAITDAFATGWSFVGNSIYGNGFGISLTGSDSISPPLQNDLDDPDTGANNRQNYPVLGAGIVGPRTTVQVSGSLNSEANTTYRLQFFANAGCDQSGHGQGKLYLSSADIFVTTNPNDVTFGPIALTTPIDRHVITATATDPNGNTSEFSDCSLDDTIFSDSFEGN